MSRSVVKEWLAERCTLKQQTVLLSALRGCDGIPKEDCTKQLTRALRGVLLHSANPSDEERTFMMPVNFEEARDRFLAHPDHYPVHWLFHFAHAAEIVGYKHPSKDVRKVWSNMYWGICNALHVNMESEESMDWRLRDLLDD